jgi:hypothetical protein
MFCRTAIFAVIVALVGSACAGSDVEEPIPAAGATTTTAAPSVTESTDQTTAPGNVSSPTTSPNPASPEAFANIDVASPWPVAVTLWDSSGAKKLGALTRFAQVIDGPIVNVVEVPLEGWVYQRELYSNVIHFDDGTGEQELLVATGDQTLVLEGVRLLADETPEIVYQRRDPEGQETVETLRGFNFATGEVREITVTGGFESLTKFSTINGRYAVGLFQGEGHFELTILDLDTGQRPYSSADQDFDCFDGGDPECPDYDEALMIDNYVYGFRTWVSDETVQRGLYRFDLGDNTEVLLWALDAEQGVYARDLIQAGEYLVLSFSSTFSYEDFGNPLRALLYNLSTGEAKLAPDAGFVQLSWVT